MSEQQLNFAEPVNHDFGAEPRESRSLFGAMFRGMRGKCPSCGRAPLFERLLATTENCPTCGLEIHHHRADDLPAYLNIFIVGHVVVGAMMVIMTFGWFGMWTFTAITLAVALVSAVFLMRPIKGAVVGAQWALGMHGFGNEGD